jgi:hypothetical protein
MRGHRLLADSWARKLRDAEGEAKILRDWMNRADKIAGRYAESSSVEEVGSERRRRAR